jgi:hypothetical protein
MFLRLRFSITSDLPRAQLATSTRFRGFSDVLTTVFREHGFKGLYKGLSPTLAGVAPYAALKFATLDAFLLKMQRLTQACRRYEAMKVFLAERIGITEPTPLMRLASGTFAGMLAQTFIYPLVRRMLLSFNPEIKQTNKTPLSL